MLSAPVKSPDNVVDPVTTSGSNVVDPVVELDWDDGAP